MAGSNLKVFFVASLLGGASVTAMDPKLFGFSFGDDLTRLSLTTSSNQVGFVFNEKIQKGEI